MTSEVWWLRVIDVIYLFVVLLIYLNRVLENLQFTIKFKENFYSRTVVSVSHLNVWYAAVPRRTVVLLKQKKKTLLHPSGL